MGWTDWLVKFENKSQVFIDWEKFSVFADKYGDLVLSEHTDETYELCMKNPVGSFVLVHGTPESGVSAISINKPTDNEFIRPFVFGALNSLGMILCDENFSWGYSFVDLKNHIPDEILQDGIRIIKSEKDLYV